MESLARGGPWLLGVVRRGQSTWQALSEADTEKYGGSSRRRLYGCVFTIFPDRARMAASGEVADGRGLVAFEQQLLTWSQVVQSLLGCISPSGDTGLTCLHV